MFELGVGGRRPMTPSAWMLNNNLMYLKRLRSNACGNSRSFWNMKMTACLTETNLLFVQHTMPHLMLLQPVGEKQWQGFCAFTALDMLAMSYRRGTWSG